MTIQTLAPDYRSLEEKMSLAEIDRVREMLGKEIAQTVASIKHGKDGPVLGKWAAKHVSDLALEIAKLDRAAERIHNLAEKGES